MEYKRQQIDILRERILEKRKFIQIITGPRQVGKTTLVSQFLEGFDKPFHFSSADGLGVFGGNWLRQQWEIARIKLKTGDAGEVVLIIDEVQKIENWSEIVKSEWDKDTFHKINIKVVLLGSSTLLLQKGMSESLMGRFEQINLFHWSFDEMQTAFGFGVDEYVWFGGYPGAADLISSEKRWKNYVLNSLIEPTITKDILLLKRINKPSLLRQLFELGCIYSGQILSYNKMLGQLQDAGNTTTLSHYLDLLDNAGLLAGIKKFFIKKIREKTSSPKFQVYNTALISGQSSLSFDEVKKRSKEWGRIVESAIGSHLINKSKTENFDVFYWRHVNEEIDFVLRYKDEIIGIEVKSGQKQKATGLKEFNKRFNPKKILLVGNSGILLQDFLKINPVDLF